MAQERKQFQLRAATTAPTAPPATTAAVHAACSCSAKKNGRKKTRWSKRFFDNAGYCHDDHQPHQQVQREESDIVSISSGSLFVSDTTAVVAVAATAFSGNPQDNQQQLEQSRQLLLFSQPPDVDLCSVGAELNRLEVELSAARTGRHNTMGSSDDGDNNGDDGDDRTFNAFCQRQLQQREPQQQQHPHQQLSGPLYPSIANLLDLSVGNILDLPDDHRATTDTAEDVPVASYQQHRRAATRPGLEEQDDVCCVSTAATHEPILPQRLVCQCCYEDILSSDDDWVTCANPDAAFHCFCSPCLNRYVEEWVFGGAAYPLMTLPRNANDINDPEGIFRCALPCMAISCDGRGHIPNEAIKHAVSALVWNQFVEKMQRIRNAKITGIALGGREGSDDIPNVVDATASATTAYQQNRSDSLPSQGSSIDESIHRAEEALTDTKVRKCGVCHTRFLKEEDTCNKMRCPSCQYCTCYICRKPVDSKGYEHFCRHKYDASCDDCQGKCPLWSTTKNDYENDQSALREVAEDMANRLWEESLLSSSAHHQHQHYRSFEDSEATSSSVTAAEEFLLNVERLLHDPSTTDGSDEDRYNISFGSFAS